MANFNTQTSASLSRYDLLPFNQSLGASPYTYQNTANYEQDLVITLGTVSLIELSRDNVTWYATGVLAGMLSLSIGDRIKITYAVAPAITVIPR